MNPRFVSFHYVLKDRTGKILDSSHDGEPMTYIEGAQQIIPGLEKNLTGMNKGEKKRVVVEAEDAYGDRDERLIMEVPRKDLPNSAGVEEGMEYQVQLEEGSSHVFRVTEVGKTHAKLDGNHPLAGEDLFFDVEIHESRDATPQELEEAEEQDCDHDHGPDGHCH